jgi:hypothetical protein
MTWIEGSQSFCYDDKETGRECWEPLDDDGQAFRLAISLHIDILQFKHYKDYVHCNIDRMGKSFPEKFNEDPRAATRRAIVRAAAYIGSLDRDFITSK